MLLQGGAMTVREYWYINEFKLESLSNIWIYGQICPCTMELREFPASLCALALIISEVSKGSSQRSVFRP